MSPACETASIVDEVQQQLRGRLRQFKIESCPNGIVLSGEAPTFYVKQLAQHAVSRITPLPIVRNEIHVTSRDSGSMRVQLHHRRSPAAPAPRAARETVH